ncbi:hypothetical protein sos41_20120 [Alphaproteobacteria bacterium SO-S41]|nr:hypothetical protein sos41_20120 [Alphaproteobacteria bacterium SO-S41]
MFSFNIKYLRRFCLALSLLISPLSARADEAAGDTMMILDASGSMWGVVNGETKIAGARTAVRGLLEAWPASRKLGLMAYGHRRKGDCGDIETIAPIGTIDAAALAATVDKLNPKGKTPIADSITKAAGELKSTEAKATILLVSDGIETCGGDPCAVAKALEESGVDFTAHVIGFDITDPNAKAQLQCIADVTGGVYRDAADAAGLADALKETASASGGAPKEPPAAAPEVVENTLRGNLRLSADSDPLVGYSTAISWHVKRSGSDEEVDGGVGASFLKFVEPGDYIVSVDYGNAVGEAPAKIEAGKLTTVDIVLNAGRVVSEAAQAGIPGSASHDWGQLSWNVYKADDRTAYLTYSFDPVPTFVLPEGDYVLTVTKDELAKAEKPFTVKAGDELNVGLELVAGTFKFSAPGSYIVQIRQNGQDVASLNEVEGEKAMTPGDYVFVVSYAEGEPIERPFTIKEGETTELTVTK